MTISHQGEQRPGRYTVCVIMAGTNDIAYRRTAGVPQECLKKMESWLHPTAPRGGGGYIHVCMCMIFFVSNQPHRLS